MQFDQWTRRAFITLFGGAAVYWPVVANAETRNRPTRSVIAGESSTRNGCRFRLPVQMVSRLGATSAAKSTSPFPAAKADDRHQPQCSGTSQISGGTSKRPRCGASEAAKLLGRFTPQKALVLGSTRYSTSADADFQCQPERQLTWALKSTAEKNGPGPHRSTGAIGLPQAPERWNQVCS